MMMVVGDKTGRDLSFWILGFQDFQILDFEIEMSPDAEIGVIWVAGDEFVVVHQLWMGMG